MANQIGSKKRSTNRLVKGYNENNEQMRYNNLNCAIILKMRLLQRCPNYFVVGKKI